MKQYVTCFASRLKTLKKQRKKQISLLSKQDFFSNVLDIWYTNSFLDVMEVQKDIKIIKTLFHSIQNKTTTILKFNWKEMGCKLVEKICHEYDVGKKKLKKIWI
jgi:hypothetical protein